MKLLRQLFSCFSLNGRCVVCGKQLRSSEQDICVNCLSTLPFTNLQGKAENKLERYFWEQLPIERATSLFTYYRGARTHQILRNLKYRKQPSIGISFGRIMARQLKDTGFFDTIDMIIPVPLAKERFHKRGYNQSECIARGIAEIVPIPVVTDGVERQISNATQTRLSRRERMQNVEGIFHVSQPERFNGKHLLLIDDVVTSSATLVACGKAFKKSENTRFSILTLAMAASITEVPYYSENHQEDTENQEGEVFIP